MFFVILIMTFFAICILVIGFFKKINGLLLVIFFIISLYLSLGSTKTECRDGWSSPSIGVQGACSWHGGVTTRFTSFGKKLLLVDIVIIVFPFLLNRKDEENPK
ncbi:MAG: hypothetical protein QM535_12280 [Limnohabitans sp.]|nr:hypothetical protein [Limnohabitans sp.]